MRLRVGGGGGGRGYSLLVQMTMYCGFRLKVLRPIFAVKKRRKPTPQKKTRKATHSDVSTTLCSSGAKVATLSREKCLSHRLSRGKCLSHRLSGGGGGN